MANINRVVNGNVFDHSLSSAYSERNLAQAQVLKIREELRRYTTLSICWMFIHMSLSASIISETPLVLAIVPIMIYYTTQIGMTALKYRAVPHKITLLFSMGEYLCILLATIIFICASVTNEVRYTYSVLPLGIGEILGLIQVVGKRNDCNYRMKGIKILSSITRLLQVINACLKLDGVVNWSWFLVFWPAFLDLVIIGILGIVPFLMLIGLLACKLSNEDGNKEYACYVWAIFACIGGSACIGAFLIYLSLILESQADMQVIPSVSISPIIFYIFFTIFTHLYLIQISYWLFPLFSRPYVLPISTAPHARVSPMVSTPILQESSPLVPTPKLLVTKAINSTLRTISSTYFKATDSASSSIELNLNNTYIEGEKEKSPNVNHRRSSSVGLSTPKSEFSNVNHRSSTVSTPKSKFPNVNHRRSTLSTPKSKFSNVNPTSSTSLSLCAPKSKSKLDDIKLCLVCTSKAADGVLMNCGHGGVCHTCAVEILKESGICHLCRKNISQVLKVKKLNKKYVQVTSATSVKPNAPIINSE